MTEYTPRAFNMAEIDAAIEEMSPASRKAREDEVDEIALGLDAMDLADEHLARGRLDQARRWFRVAAAHGADGAIEALAEVDTLINATQTPAVTHLAAGTPFEHDPDIDDATRVAALDDLADAATLVRRAKDTAARVIDDAHRQAEKVLADARPSPANLTLPTHWEHQLMQRLIANHGAPLGDVAPHGPWRIDVAARLFEDNLLVACSKHAAVQRRIARLHSNDRPDVENASAALWMNCNRTLLRLTLDSAEEDQAEHVFSPISVWGEALSESSDNLFVPRRFQLLTEHEDRESITPGPRTREALGALSRR